MCGLCVAVINMGCCRDERKCAGDSCLVPTVHNQGGNTFWAVMGGLCWGTGWFGWALKCLQYHSCWDLSAQGKEVLEHKQISVKTRVPWPVKQTQIQGLLLVVTGYHLHSAAGPPSNWLWVGRKYLSFVGVLFSYFFNVWWCIHMGVKRRKCWRWMPNLPFLPFPLYLSVLDFPIHTFDDILLVARICLAFPWLRPWSYLVSTSVEWQLFQWRKGRGPNRSYDKTSKSFMACGFYETVFSRQTDF